MVRALKSFAAVLCLVGAAACSSSSSATPTPAPTPTPTPTPSTPKLTAPAASSPADAAQQTTLRPTLVVTNGTSDVTGTRTYEFQVSDRSDFCSNCNAAYSTVYPVNASKTNVSEGTTTTSVALDADLQPATRYWWRARMTQGTTISDWSATRTFLSQVVGYNQPGELYDPLVNGSTIADLRFKRTTFVPGQGLRVDDSDSYVMYKLAQTVSAGEFSLDAIGLSAFPVSENPDTGKLKILSMCDCPANFPLYASAWLMDVQYRGFNGNPPQAISFKMLLGVDADDHKLEPDLGTRIASVRNLSAANTYYWKAVWGGGVNVTVQDGGAGAQTGQGGNTIYNYGQTSTFAYFPIPHYAYLGVNNSGSETGSWPLTTYRNVWIGSKTRPTTLGSALR